MNQRGRGRPRKIDPSRKKLTLDQALELIRSHYAQYNLSGCSKQHLYNLISKGELEKERLGSHVLIYEDEVKKKFCG